MNADPPKSAPVPRRLRFLRSCPEYALFESEKVGARAIDELDKELETSRRYWLQVLLSAGLVGTMLLGFHFVLDELPWCPNWARIAAIVIGNAALFALILWLWRRNIISRLRDKLIELGIPVCRSCGYPMRGLPLPRCPECGWKADDAVRALVADSESADRD